MEALSRNSLFEIAKNFNYDTLADLCQSNKQWFAACKNDSQLSKLVESRKLEWQLLNHLSNVSAFTYTLAGRWGASKQHFIKFAKYDYYGVYEIRETLVSLPERLSILNRFFPILAKQLLLGQTTFTTLYLTLEEVRPVLRFLIESPKFNLKNLEFDRK